MRAGLANQSPNEIMGAFTREQAELAVQGVPSGVAATGASLPDADLLDAHGTPTTLYRVIDGRPAVIVFYRGVWCPYCNLALSTYQTQLLPALIGRDVTLIAVSPQVADETLSMQQKNAAGLPGGVRPRQHLGPVPRRPRPRHRLRSGQRSSSSASTSPLSTPMAPPPSPCPPPSSSMPTT